MALMFPHEGSLVLYRGRPALVTRAGDKLDLALADGETARVRAKDVELLHPGPLARLADLARPVQGEVEAAWEILAGGQTTVPELAELAFGAYTPVTAWAAWQLAADGLYFRGTPDALTVATPAEVSQRRAARAAEAAERQAWQAFLARVRAGKTVAEDARYLKDVEALALGHAAHSRALQALGREETPENAHALLLDVGAWDETVDPYPSRLGLTLTMPTLAVPDLPADERVDLTHLAAYAVDDALTDTPDDAVSFDGERLWVHVADPAAIILPDDALDLEARGRGASLYLPETTIPMLPRRAIDLLGLGLGPVSPALSFGLLLGAEGQPAQLEIVPSWLRVTRLTYEAVETRLAEAPFAGLLRVTQAHRARRLAQGAIELDWPEIDLRVRDGEVTLTPVARLRSRDLVQEAMIMAGAAVAGHAIGTGLALPFATQESGIGPDEPHVGTTYAEMFALRRALRRSQYRGVPAPHAGLGLPAYVQVTSPLRRYLDLVAHQQLRAALAGRPPLDPAALLERVGSVEAIAGSLRQAENLADRHWTLVYLSRHGGWRGEGILIDKRGLSGTALIPEFDLETSVRLPSDVPLDSRLPLALGSIDLPRLDARFRLVAS